MPVKEQLEIEATKRWLVEHCHRSEFRHVLERGLEYYAAVNKAGICTESTGGDDLYSFLTDPSAATARSRAFVEPTL